MRPKQTEPGTFSDTDWIDCWPEGVVLIDEQGRMHASNNWLFERLGISAGETGDVHATLCGVGHPQHDAEHCPLVRALAKRWHDRAFDVLLPDRQGLLVRFDARVLPFARSALQILHLREVPDGALSIGQSMRLAEFTEGTSAPVMEVDRQGNILYANSAMTELMAEYGFDEHGRAVVLDEQFCEHVQQVVQTGEPIRVNAEKTVQTVALDGGTVQTRIAYSWHYTASSDPVTPLVTVSGFETTALLDSMRALAEQKDSYRLTLDVAETGVIDILPHQTVVSDRCLQMLGMADEANSRINGEERLRRLLARLEPGDAARLRNALAETSKSGGQFELAAEGWSSTGTRLPLLIRGRGVPSGSQPVHRIIATLTETSRLREFKRQITMQRAALEQAGTGVLILNSGLSVTYANSRWVGWFGDMPESSATADEFAAQSVFGPEGQALRLLVHNAAAGVVGEQAFTAPKDDTPLWLSFYPLRSASGDTIGLVCFARDMTEEQEKEQALIRARLAAETALQSRNQALEALQVEVADPRATLRESLEILIRNTDDPNLRRHLDIARGAALQLSTLAVTLFEELRYEDSGDNPRPAAFQLENFLQSCQRQATRLGDQSSVQVQFDVPEALPLEGYADERLFDQAFQTLFRQALWYNTSGLIRIEVRLQRAVTEASPQKGSDTRVFEIRIHDGGRGFDSKDLQRLDQPFAMITDPTGRLSVRPGLNISIARHLANAVGGQVEIQPGSAGGVEYALFLPFLVLQDANATQENQYLAFSAAVDLRYLDSQTRTMKEGFLTILEDIAGELARAATDLSSWYQESQYVRILDELNSLHKISENFGLYGLREALDLLHEELFQQATSQRNPLIMHALTDCLQRTRTILDNYLKNARQKEDRSRTAGKG